MRFLFGLFLLVGLVSCSQNPKGYLKFSGKLENNKDTLITILGYGSFKKQITIDKNGSFTDTIKIKFPGIYTMVTNSGNRSPIFLDNGFNLNLSGNAEEFLTSFEFSGNGSVNSNYIVDQVKYGRTIPRPDSLYKLSEADFALKLKEIEKGYKDLIEGYTGLDSNLIDNSKKQTSDIIFYLKTLYERDKKMGIGKDSPKFVDYKNYKGGKTSLDDFKGSFVYIDVWATWCGPCIQQIPYLKKIEEEFKNKNIVFVSISTDEPQRSGGSWEAAEKKWRDFVKNRSLGGVQLWAGQDFYFQQAYEISGIPRFILVDDKGKIRAYNAPRPSDPALKVLLKSVGLKDKQKK